MILGAHEPGVQGSGKPRASGDDPSKGQGGGVHFQ